MKRKPRRSQAGFNLLEVLIATLVLSLGLLGLAGLQVGSLKATQNASLKQGATLVLYDLLERMRSNRQTVLAGDYVQTTHCAASPPAACSTTCSPAEQASHDLYQALCLNNSQRLPVGQLVITCPTGGDCGLGLHFLLTWEERLEQRGIQASPASSTTGQATAEKEQDAISLEMDAVI
ncbi:type IV pilus modification protein PilV [Thiothrix eikelboomii]|uniref:type IV pilus modification protein PilV n=1 Tax=Thiothrix eikelboomii TaxID=92487 RepID=UPI003BB12036